MSLTHFHLYIFLLPFQKTFYFSVLLTFFDNIIYLTIFYLNCVYFFVFFLWQSIPSLLPIVFYILFSSFCFSLALFFLVFCFAICSHFSFSLSFFFSPFTQLGSSQLVGLFFLLSFSLHFISTFVFLSFFLCLFLFFYSSFLSY